MANCNHLPWVSLGSVVAECTEVGVRDEPRSGCAVNAAVEGLGDQWSLIALRDVMFGGRRHFRELLSHFEEGIAPEDVSTGLVPHRAAKDASPARRPGVVAGRDQQGGGARGSAGSPGWWHRRGRPRTSGCGTRCTAC